MSDMGALSHSEATVSCIVSYAEPDRRPIRSIRTLNGRTSKFGWLQAPATNLTSLNPQNQRSCVKLLQLLVSFINVQDTLKL